MRLLKIEANGEFSLTVDIIHSTAPYAILSHTWGENSEEVTFEELNNGPRKTKSGYRKLRFCSQQAARDGLQYFWVDTCCINRSKESELTEAINSTFRWYHNAAKCYVYLTDVSTSDQVNLSIQPWEAAFRNSRWFTRAWTLQELIAPQSVEFFCSNGNRLGDKKSLKQHLQEITGIPVSALQGTPTSEFSFDKRMSWAQHRAAIRDEDHAYSLLGIFDISMPVMYGEGGHMAIHRLRQELDVSSHLGYSSATVTAQDSALLARRATHHEDTVVHRSNIAEPDGESHLREGPAALVRRCRSCSILFCFWIFFAVLSLIVGLWRSYATSDEGKGFTDAAYVVAVGGLILFPVQNRHSYVCKRK